MPDKSKQVEWVKVHLIWLQKWIFIGYWLQMVWKQVYDLVNNSSDMLWQIFKPSFSFHMYKPKEHTETGKSAIQRDVVRLKKSLCTWGEK